MEGWAGLVREEDTVSFDEAIKEGETRIIFAGPRRSGKSSIERVVFHKMSPHETLFLESTLNVDIHYIANNNFVKFQTWDFGGDLNLQSDITYMGRNISPETLIKKCSTMVYVIDAQEEEYEEALPKLVETISVAHSLNPSINFEVFLHKVDGDFMSEEAKAERQQVRASFVENIAVCLGDIALIYDSYLLTPTIFLIGYPTLRLHGIV
jgi:Ras-related GTP-binding protein C/D